MKKIFKIGCGTIIGFFVFILALGLIFGEDTTNENASKETKQNVTEDSTEEAEGTEKVEEEIVAKVGEELTVGDVAFTVNKVEEVSEISTANGYVTYKPESEGAVYLVLNVTVKNNSNEMIQTTSSFFQLNSGEIQYSPSTIIATDEKFFTFEDINPGLSLTGNVLFEIPPGLTDLDLEVQTGFWGTEKGTIKLN